MSVKCDFEAYSIGLCYMSVCTSLTSTADIELRVNQTQPTGIESCWHLSEDKTFADGQTSNPCQCDMADDRKHYLLTC